MSGRGQWQGMLTIARFNWPFYVAAAAVLIGSLWGVLWLPTSQSQWICGFALVGAFYFLAGSLAVSHLIYDRSDLYRWKWLDRALRDANRNRMLFCHSGFDEASQALHEKLDTVEWQVLDHFDEKQMTEQSIRRARKLFPPTTGTVRTPYDQWAVESETIDVIFGLLAIHELRSERERMAWFCEASRCLKKDGMVVLVEHTRDLANFLVFGPGFLHFHSSSSWRRCWERVGLRARDEFQITPWIRVFVISAL